MWEYLWNLLDHVDIWQMSFLLGGKDIYQILTHWGRETHIYVGEHANIGSDNGLSPNLRQAIIWTNAGILLIEPQGTNFNEILIEIHTFSFKKMHLKMSSAKWRPFCLNLNVWYRASGLCFVNTSRVRQIANILQMPFSISFYLHEYCSILIKILSTRFQMTINHHWYRSWLGAKQVTSHYLNSALMSKYSEKWRQLINGEKILLCAWPQIFLRWLL